MIRIINEYKEIKNIVASSDYISRNGDASDEPFRDSLSAYIVSLKDSVKELEEYNMRSQSEMKTMELNSILRDINSVVIDIRRILGLNKGRRK